MGIIRFAIDNPVKVAVGVILVTLFGLISIFSIPIQLTPDVDRPVVFVSTFWRGASPQEIETEIIDRQEDKLKGVTNLYKMTSEASQGRASIRLEFPVGTDRDIAYRDVSDKLRQVTDYPDEVDEPVMSLTDRGMEKTIAWIMFYSKEGQDVSPLKTFVWEKVKPILERAEGISDVDVYGGRDRELQVQVDPYRLAARDLTFADVAAALRGQNTNVSAGTVRQGKRDYSYRTMGEYATVQDVEDTVIAYRAGGPVFVRDVAEVEDGFAKQESFVRSKGRSVLAIPARRETGANVIRAMENLKAQIELVNREILEPRGLGLELTQVYDETKYINSAVSLVFNNILLGGGLAIVVLIVFLRSGSATGIIAVAIPISVIGTILVVTMLGRSLNVVMLAGMAFAVGMVVDNAIVVLENIYRHRSMGKSRAEAAFDGAREVWGAVLASTLTTMAVFLPVIFIQEEAGQLFRDIAIAISSAVALSLLVSVLVIPPLASRFFRASAAMKRSGDKPWFVASIVSGLVSRMNARTSGRLACVAGFSAAAILGSWLLAPATEYLPTGNRNLIFGFLQTPPGYSIEEFKHMARIVEEGDPDDPVDGVRPFWEASADDYDHLPEVEVRLGKTGEEVVTVQPPPIDNFFFVSFGGGAFMGCTSKIETVVSPLVQVMNRAGQRVPGVFTIFNQSSLFTAGISGGNSVDVEVRGASQTDVASAAAVIQREIMEAGFGYARPSPANFDLGRPEIQIIPKRTIAADMGLSVRDLGFISEALINGAFVGEYNDRGDKIDMVIKVAGTEEASIADIAQMPIRTPTGDVVPLASAVDLKTTTAPQQINHIEEMNSVTLSVNPKVGVPLGDTMRELNEEIIAPLRAQGVVPESVITSLAGTADKLTQTQRAMLGDFRGAVTGPRLFGLSIAGSIGLLLLGAVAVGAASRIVVPGRTAVLFGLAGIGAIVLMLFVTNPELLLRVLESRMILALLITYLLMAALFESFVYPFVIMFSVPLAAVGGFVALAIVHEVSLRDVASPIQQLDVVTMLGFVILIGIVVNNAILIVHQALNVMREQGVDPQAAVVESVKTRTRPIFMSAFTSIFGMAPLVVMTGAGSELYRGIGSVMLGGLLVSTVFTLVVVPAMFSLTLQFQGWLTAGAQVEPVPVAAKSQT